MAELSRAHQLAALPPKQRREFLAGLSPEELQQIPYLWPLWRMPHQTPPEGDWRVWILSSGRGAGKSVAGAEWVREQMETGRRRCIALVAATHLAGRKQMIEDALLRRCPPWNMPTYEMATGKVVWPNGGVCHLVTAESPERIRGYNFDSCWGDELGAWENAEEVWLQLQLATRVRGPMGDDPQFVVTTTPRSIPLLKGLLADPSTRVSRASTFVNAANLSAETLKALKDRYAGTSVGRQELYGELLEDVDEALWRRQWIDGARVKQAPPDLVRVVVGVDPAVTSDAGSAETGIIAAGKDATGHAYVLADASLKAMPDVWARRVASAYHQHTADKVIAEANNGGDLVLTMLRTADPKVPVQKVHAARGKQTRAEPVARYISKVAFIMSAHSKFWKISFAVGFRGMRQARTAWMLWFGP